MRACVDCGAEVILDDVPPVEKKNQAACSDPEARQPNHTPPMIRGSGDRAQGIGARIGAPSLGSRGYRGKPWSEVHPGASSRLSTEARRFQW